MDHIKREMPLWDPTESLLTQSNMALYKKWLKETKDIHVEDYSSLWKWSVDHLEEFWASIWEHFNVIASSPFTKVLEDQNMPGAQWFPGAKLNYA